MIIFAGSNPAERMSENQNIEYKESWRTEYLKWVCGFANAQGGTIYVGLNDKGNVVGLPDADNPRYELIGNGLRVHFAALKSALVEDSEIEKDDKLGESTSTTQKSGPKKWPESSQKSSQKTIQRIIELIVATPSITLSEIAEQLGMTRRGIDKNIQKLKHLGLIRRVGPAKGGHWEVIKTDEE